MSASNLPDYYRILQVHPDAESDIIDVAYRRLIRKYHPDALDPSQRDDPAVQATVRAITEAYGVLHDPGKRAHYDTLLRNTDTQHRVEQRTYPARCAKTKQVFLLQLARAHESSGPFYVVGIGPVQAPPTDPPQPETRLHRFVRSLLASRRPAATPNPSPLTPTDLLRRFNPAEVLDFGDIDWAGFMCPVCSGIFTYPDGMISTWGVCGKCGHLYCAGATKPTATGGLVICPWCATPRQITYHVRTGTKAHKLVRGQQNQEEQTQSPERKRLPTDMPKHLAEPEDNDL